MRAACAALLVLTASVANTSAEPNPSVTDDSGSIHQQRASPRPASPRQLPAVPPPEDPIAAKAFHALERSCATCHQVAAPAEGRRVAQFGNILDLAALARAPDLVRPGAPDASPLYTIMLTGHAEIDLEAAARADNAGFAMPLADDAAAVRTWIETLPVVGGCYDRAPISVEDVHDLARRWLQQVGPDKARDTRFVSLAHLHNACSPLADLAGYRQALHKLLNSLSWTRSAGSIDTIGDGLALLVIRLNDFGWIGEHWEALAAERNVVPRRWQAAGDLVAATGTSTPILPADWLARAATSSTLYPRLLGLPPKLEAFEGLKGLETAEAVTSGNARRVALAASRESSGPVIVERHATGTEAVWLGYELDATTKPEAILAHPLLPYGAEGRDVPEVARTRLITSLPNGFLAFALYDADGILVGSPDSAVKDRAAGGLQRCLACHGQGLVGVGEVLKPVSGSSSGGKSSSSATSPDRSGAPIAGDEATAIGAYATAAEIAQHIADDNFVYRRALIQSGIDPDLRVRGLDPVLALAREHARDVTLSRLAAELGLPAEALRDLLDQYDGAEVPLAQRLRQGVLTRREADRLALGLGAATAGSGPEPGDPRGDQPRLALWTEKPTYAVGEPVAISATASADCYLTIVNVDGKGRGTVVFPNAFERGSLLQKGKTITVPSADAPYRLKLSDPGRESFVGICRQDAAVPRGMLHDFERQLFTSLGSWSGFVVRALTAPTDAKPERATRRKVRRRRRDGSEPGEAELPPVGSGAEARAAVYVEIE